MRCTSLSEEGLRSLSMTAMRRFSISNVAAQGMTSIIMQGKKQDEGQETVAFQLPNSFLSGNVTS